MIKYIFRIPEMEKWYKAPGCGLTDDIAEAHRYQQGREEWHFVMDSVRSRKRSGLGKLRARQVSTDRGVL